MKFSYNWLKSLVNFKESPEKLAELLTLRSFEVEGIEKVGKDFALDVKITANRMADAASHWGLAKEIAAIGSYELRIDTNYGSQNKKAARGDTIKVIIKPSDLCLRYTAQLLEVKTLGQSPHWMQERLLTCGLRPINAVVDITNYVMLETGQPLHAFDLDKILPTNYESKLITNKSLTIRESRPGEELTTLDGTRHILPAGIIVIEDRKRLIDLAGIMGGKNSAVSESTKKILLQSSVFDSVKIYKASRALNFSSPASKLYSAGLDPNQSPPALNRASELLEEIVKAKRIGTPLDIYPQPQKPSHILFRSNYANGIIGQKLTSLFYKSLFKRLGFLVEREDNEFVVEVPTTRRDIEREEDLIEEAARLFGYERIKAEMPTVSLLPPPRNNEFFWEERMRDFLVGAGFAESLLYEFIGDKELDEFTFDRENIIELENPVSPETKYLVPRAIIKYVSSAAENLKHENEVRIFGAAKSFFQTNNNFQERKDLILVLAKKGDEGEEKFYQLKGLLDQMLEALGINEAWYDDAIESAIRRNAYRFFHPYRMAEVKVNDTLLGVIGEINPTILHNIKSRARVVAAKIDFEKLWKIANTEHEYRPLGKFPSITRDIAVVVPQETPSMEVTNLIENTGGPLMIDSDLFDYFQDETMREAEGKSLAFHLTFESPERTLQDKEVDKIVAKIIKALEAEGWEVRK